MKLVLIALMGESGVTQAKPPLTRGAEAEVEIKEVHDFGETGICTQTGSCS